MGRTEHIARAATLGRRGWAAIAAIALLAMPPPCDAQSLNPGKPLFAEDIPLALTLEGPFRTLSRDPRDRTEHDGILRYQDPSGAAVTLDVQLRTRGNSRPDICTYPPLRLNLRRGQVEGTVFAGQNQLKLVTLCKNPPFYRDYLAVEFRIYRALNLLTPISYRVRWVEIQYIDTDRPQRTPATRPGFLIEEDTDVAARNAMEVWRVDALDIDDLDPSQTALIGLFQFMVGNTDWSGVAARSDEPCCHNVDVLRDPQGRAMLLPYDFDQVGLIHAEFAKPPQFLPISSVRQRLYRGYCAHNAELEHAIEALRAAQADVEALFSSQALGDTARRRAMSYLEEFYAILADPGERRAWLVEACRE